MNLSDKKKHYKAEIEKIASSVYNGEQKQLACYILDNANADNIDSIYTFITQRVKLGFTFDAAPEVNHNCISLVRHNPKLTFGNIGGEHKLIIGENYDALKNLLVTYTKDGKGLIDVIYIDPPYNTEAAKGEGNNYKDDVEAKKFIYRDKYTRNGWLNMMRERLVMARKLLSDTGVIFVSIDDTEQAYLKVLMDEIFGENNFVVCIAVNKSSEIASENVIQKHEYMLCYCKNSDLFQVRGIPKYSISRGTVGNEDQTSPTITFPRGLKCYNIPDGEYKETRKIYGSKENVINFDPIIVRNGLLDNDVRMKARWRSSNDMRNFFNNNCLPTKAKINGTIEEIYFENDRFNPQIKKATYEKIPSMILDNERGSKYLEALGMGNCFDNPKSVKTIKKLIQIVALKDNSIVLDFFAGSGTTGQAVMELNSDDGGTRKCILVTNNENNIATDITYERLYRLVNGKGTKGEKFPWTYKPEQPYLTNNRWEVFELEQAELKIDDFDKAKELLAIAEKEFKLLNPNYDMKGLDIYNQLASLNPYKATDTDKKNDKCN